MAGQAGLATSTRGTTQDEDDVRISEVELTPGFQVVEEVVACDQPQGGHPTQQRPELRSEEHTSELQSH